MLQLLLDYIAVLRTYIDAVYCYRPSSVVCRSVCHLVNPGRDAVCVEDSVWPRETPITYSGPLRGEYYTAI